MTGLLVTTIAFAVIGLALCRVVGSTSPFLLGLGSLGMTLYVALLLHVPMISTLIVLAIAGIVLLLVKRPPSPRPTIDAAALLMCLPLALLLFVTAVVPLHDFDGRAFWLLKAKAIATEHLVDGPFFHQQTTYDARNRYPLLVPLDAAAVMVASRDLDDQHVRWLYPLTLFGLAIHARKWIGAWPAALLPWIPQFAVTQDGGVTSAYNDVIVAAFAGCAFLELVDRRSPLRFGLWLAFLTLTKSEGLPYAIVLVAAGVFIFGKRIATSLLPLTVAVATLLIWRSRVPSGDEENFIARLPLVSEKLDRLMPAALGVMRHATRFDTWGLFWIATIGAAIVLLIRRRGRDLILPAYILSTMLGIYLVAYAVSYWAVRDLVDQSADRLLMQLVVPALYVIGRTQASMSATAASA
ncbi:MAG TPA: hypothetical protein VGK04_08395 [Thermoanaerobaculia bacterium]